MVSVTRMVPISFSSQSFPIRSSAGGEKTGCTMPILIDAGERVASSRTSLHTESPVSIMSSMIQSVLPSIGSAVRMLIDSTVLADE